MRHRFPSQPFQNPKGNVSPMTLRNGKELKKLGKSREEEQEIDVNEPEPNKNQDPTSNAKEAGENEKESYKPLLPFSSRLRRTSSRVDKAKQEILKTFRKVEINITLLDAIN